MFVLTDEYREELYKRGLSVELTERIEADGVVPFEIIIGGDSCSIWTHPPVERNDLMYFIIFKGGGRGREFTIYCFFKMCKDKSYSTRVYKMLRLHQG